MKVKVIINSCIIVMCFAFFSCSQDEEVYSCNKEVNAWVKENLSGIQQMDRIDWLQLDEGLKRGVYVAFEPEQKQMFWIEKIHEILLLDWNEPEKSHIEVLYQTVLDNPHWFTKDRTEKEYEEYDLFQYKWIEYAKEQLAWSDRQIASIAATGNKVLDKNGKIQINNTAPRLKSGVECDCNVSINICFPKGCLAKEYSNCIEKSIGCGLLFLAPCNGLCTSL